MTTPLHVFVHPSVLGFVWLAICVTALVAFIDAMARPIPAWIYAGEKRNVWVPATFAALVGAVVFGGLFSGFGMWIALAAAMYYLVDKKPKLAAYQPPNRREDNLHDNWR